MVSQRVCTTKARAYLVFRGQFVNHIQVEGIEGLWAIQSDGDNVTLSFKQDRFLRGWVNRKYQINKYAKKLKLIQMYYSVTRGFVSMKCLQACNCFRRGTWNGSRSQAEQYN
jgi:hypothetical protein